MTATKDRGRDDECYAHAVFGYTVALRPVSESDT